MAASARRVSARVDPVQAAIDGIPADALECRRKRSHDWDGLTVVAGRVRTELYVVEECRRGCGTRRSAWFRDDGEQLTRWSSVYADGYQVAGGLPDGARKALYREYLRRLAN
jgi:hypothetical protein